MNETNLTFNEIYLNRRDMRTLKKAKNKSVSTDLCENLLLLGFVEEVKTHIPGYQPQTTETAQISILGSRYLAYIREKRSQTRRARLHDWLIAAFSVLGGALLSKPIWNWIDWVIKWLSDKL